MKDLINKIKIKNLERKGYESFTITIDGKVEYIHFWRGVQMKRLIVINIVFVLLLVILPVENEQLNTVVNGNEQVNVVDR